MTDWIWTHRLSSYRLCSMGCFYSSHFAEISFIYHTQKRKKKSVRHVQSKRQSRHYACRESRWVALLDSKAHKNPEGKKEK